MHQQIENRMADDSQWNDEPKVCCKCDDCNEDIYAGDDYYSISGMNICENCIEHYKRMATEGE